MKYVVVTGGVMSGIGKGITAASIGNLLRASGYKVTMVKMDPYLQIDAGTMSPYEHGEVFVTKDGGETDLDLGHYERFVGVELTADSSITTGKIYNTVIQKERKGEYLGETVQVIPHVIDEIKYRLQQASQNAEITVVEIGGTVGDIEGPHFRETVRQLRHELGYHSVSFVHVVPLLSLSHSGEMKTKPIQHSVMKLREVGIQADFLVCRSSQQITPSLRKKLSYFCDVSEAHIVSAVDQMIYNVPISFDEQGFNEQLQLQLFQSYKPAQNTQRKERVHSIANTTDTVNIGIAGKYTSGHDSYLSVVEALNHAGAKLSTKVNIVWLDSQEFEHNDRKESLERVVSQKKLAGVLIPGGFGKRGSEGKIHIAEYCADALLPYLGICLGLQVATIGFARKHGLKEATSTEFQEDTSEPIITILDDQKNISDKGGTMRLGSYPAQLVEHSIVSKLYGQKVISERHRHRFEVNPHYHDFLKKNGLLLSGTSTDGKLVEFIELPHHPYYVATQAHPEFQSTLENPHPLFVGLIENALKIKKIHSL